MKDIKFLVMDVDGTLTDGKIYVGNNGELFKVFNVKDGCGIKDILPQYNIVPIIITARVSEMLQNRCDELGIKELHQGIRNKLEILNAILSKYSNDGKVRYSLKNVAYIGDDMLDVPCMEQVQNAGGIVGCPGDACKTVRQMADYVCMQNGGCGAVREFIESLIDISGTESNN